MIAARLLRFADVDRRVRQRGEADGKLSAFGYSGVVGDPCFILGS
jgi:hypothetical protein